jgi:hypothetical protein
MHTKTLEEVLDEIKQIEQYFDVCRLHYSEWDIGSKMRYGQLLKMKQRRLAKELYEKQR